MPITVYENEPSSVVAFALISTEYRSKWLELIKNRSSQQLLNSTKISAALEDAIGNVTPTKTKEIPVADHSPLIKSNGPGSNDKNPSPDNPEGGQLEKSIDSEAEEECVDKETYGFICNYGLII